MKRTLGKSVSVILVLACMLSAFCIGARAVEVEPRYTGIISLSATLDINSGGQVSCYGYVSPRSGYSVDLEMELQRDGRTIKSFLARQKHSGSTDRCKTNFTCYNHIVGSAGAVDDKRIAATVLADEHAYMSIAGVKHQITRLCFAP